MGLGRMNDDSPVSTPQILRSLDLHVAMVDGTIRAGHLYSQVQFYLAAESFMIYFEIDEISIPSSYLRFLKFDMRFFLMVLLYRVLQVS